MYRKTVLDCGLSVITEEIPFFQSATVGIWAKTGSANESPEKNGISHFIEHMLFKGTSSKSASDIAEIMDECGGQSNAFTEKEATCFYAKVLGRHVPMAMDLLFEMLTDSAFRPDELERERGVVLDEISMYEDSPEDIIMDMFPSLVWKDSSLGMPVLGNRETVSSITRDDMLRYMNETYVAGNLLVCAAGNVRHDDIVSLAMKHSGSLRSGERISAPPVCVSTRASSLRIKDCEQAYLIIGREGLKRNDPDRYALLLADGMLGSSMSSRIFQEIREKRGLAYNISSFVTGLENSGLFGIYAGTSPEHLSEVASVSAEITEKMRSEGPSEAELRRAKEQLKGSIALSLENSAGRMISLAKLEFYYGRFISPEEMFEKIDAVTAEDIMRLSSSMFDTSSYSSCVLGDLSEGFKLVF